MNEEFSTLGVKLSQGLAKKDDAILAECFETCNKELISEAVSKLQCYQYEALFLRVIKLRLMVWVTVMMTERVEYFTTSSKLQSYLKNL